MSTAAATISACILALNEERRIADALRCLEGWNDEVLVIDNESDDDTAGIARRHGARVLTAPRALNFDALRNLAIEAATGDWIFYLDADERVPPRLGEILRQLVREKGDEFEALVIPFKNYFCGKWMEHSGWWPGYTRPQLLKKGRFRYNERLHSGVDVDGRSLYFPATDPDLAITHYSYDDLTHYLTKLNRYTDGEAESLLADGQSHSWQAQLAHFVQDWQAYYDRGRADLDGMHGFVLAFMSGFYRFASRAKLWDQRRLRDELADADPVPSSVEEMLAFMLHVTRHGAGLWLAPDQRPTTNDQRSVSTSPVPLLWRAPLLDASGYADESRNFVLGLIEVGEPIALAPERWGEPDAGLPPELVSSFEERTVPEDTPAEICVLHTLLSLHGPDPNARFNIARTMFETDRLPPGAAERLNRMDQIWVPTAFNQETFARSGVDPQKIRVVPEALDGAPFAAADLEPWPVPGNEPFRFLSVFDWTLHKGWDVLLEAFVMEFGGDPEVGLLLKVWSSNGYTLAEIEAQADMFLQAKLGRALAEFPNIHLWRETLPTGAMPRLYRAVNALVLPTRGEGWCRPLMEAMAAGLPTIATAWSGVTAFHNARVGYPLRYRLGPVTEAGGREIPLYAGHYWAEPSVAELRRLLREVLEDREIAVAKGRAAQDAVLTRYSRAAVAAIVRSELERCRTLLRERQTAPRPRPALSAVTTAANRSLPMRPNANPVPCDPVDPVDLRASPGQPLRVWWDGDQTVLSSLARVNREFCIGLLAAGDVELALTERTYAWNTLSERDDPRFRDLFARLRAPLSGPPDVTVRQYFPPDWRRPETGKFVVIQPWEYGHAPREWVTAISEQVDELWVYSRFVRSLYVRSGVPAEKVRIVPLGFDPAVYRPDGLAHALPTTRSLRFLFVGGALHRKGADLLLQAYLRAFTARDDVCLIVKDMGTRTFYQGQTFAEEFRRAQGDPRAPELVYLDDDLSDPELAALYRACHCVVLPYRAEGFALPPLEGMACGLPAIVTSGGPTDDYLDDTMGLRLPYRRLPAGTNRLGPFECAGDPWQLEPDFDALIDALRWVYQHPDEARRRGEAACAHARAHWTWEKATAHVREGLHALVALADKTVPGAERATPSPCQRAESGEPRAPSTLKRPIELSFCMIARDEEPRIEGCLRSIAPYVDEMIVVDTGSVDRTRELAAACGARVFELPWRESFAAARNASLEEARGDWIFWMDADDVIAPECGAALRELVRRHPGRDAAYQVQVRIPPGPGEFSPSVVDHVKLFPNRPDVRFEHRIHEQVLPALRRAGIEVLFSDLYVTHASYDRSAEGQAKKRRRDFKLLALELAENPEHPFVLFNLGMTHLYATKDLEVAAHYLRRSLDRSHWSDSIVRKAYAMLGTARICQGEWEAALAANEEGRRYYSDDAELLFQAGQIYQEMHRFDEARAALERLVSGREEPHYRSVDVGLRTYRGKHELALFYRRMGNVKECERMLREIVAAQPEYVLALMDLAETLRGLGQEDEADAFLMQMARSSDVKHPGTSP